MIANVQALIQACEVKGVLYSFLDTNKNLVRVTVGNSHYYFANATTPFNNESIAKIAGDKHFTYLALKDAVSMPRTIGYVDPFLAGRYSSYAKHSSYKDIARDVLKQFALPVVLKPNTGREGTNVFSANTEQEIFKKLQIIFNQRSKDYDYVALAQEKVKTRAEFRAIVLNQKVELVTKRYSKKTAVDKVAENQIRSFVEPLFQHLPLMWGGLDVALDTKGAFWLLEINTRPGFAKLSEELVELYKKALALLRE